MADLILLNRQGTMCCNGGYFEFDPKNADALESIGETLRMRKRPNGTCHPSVTLLCAAGEANNPGLGELIGKFITWLFPANKSVINALHLAAHRKKVRKMHHSPRRAPDLLKA